MFSGFTPSSTLASLSRLPKRLGSELEKLSIMFTFSSVAMVLAGTLSQWWYSSCRSRPSPFHHSMKASLVGTSMAPAS